MTLSGDSVFLYCRSIRNISCALNRRNSGIMSAARRQSALLLLLFLLSPLTPPDFFSLLTLPSPSSHTLTETSSSEAPFRVPDSQLRRASRLTVSSSYRSGPDLHYGLEKTSLLVSNFPISITLKASEQARRNGIGAVLLC